MTLSRPSHVAINYQELNHEKRKPKFRKSFYYTKRWRILLALAVGISLIGVCILVFYLSAESKQPDEEFLSTTNEKLSLAEGASTDEAKEWRENYDGVCFASTQKGCPADFGPKPVFLLILGGLRTDQISEIPALRQMVQCGSSAKSLVPSYPTFNYPNLYSIATGLYTESHGIVSYNMHDDELGSNFTIGSPSSHSPDWWGGEPIWNTLGKAGKKTATYLYPGSNVRIQGMYPTYWQKEKLNFHTRIKKVVDWIEMPADERPELIMMYYEQPVNTAQEFGPFSPKTMRELAIINAGLDELVTSLSNNDLFNCVDVIVASDHGVAASTCENSIYIDDLLKEDIPGRIFVGTVARVDFSDDASEKDIERITKKIECRDTSLRVLRKSQVPKRYHYTYGNRIGDLILDTKSGARVATESDNRCLEGEFGYDILTRPMQGVFVGHGPSFRTGYRTESFRNVEIYNLIAHLLDVDPAPNNGTKGSLLHMLKRSLTSDDDFEEEPETKYLKESIKPLPVRPTDAVLGKTSEIDQISTSCTCEHETIAPTAVESPISPATKVHVAAAPAQEPASTTTSHSPSSSSTSSEEHVATSSTTSSAESPVLQDVRESEGGSSEESTESSEHVITTPLILLTSASSSSEQPSTSSSTTTSTATPVMEKEEESANLAEALILPDDHEEVKSNATEAEVSDSAVDESEIIAGEQGGNVTEVEGHDQTQITYETVDEHVDTAVVLDLETQDHEPISEPEVTTVRDSETPEEVAISEAETDGHTSVNEVSTDEEKDLITLGEGDAGTEVNETLTTVEDEHEPGTPVSLDEYHLYELNNTKASNAKEARAFLTDDIVLHDINSTSAETSNTEETEPIVSDQQYESNGTSTDEELGESEISTLEDEGKTTTVLQVAETIMALNEQGSDDSPATTISPTEEETTDLPVEVESVDVTLTQSSDDSESADDTTVQESTHVDDTQPEDVVVMESANDDEIAETTEEPVLEEELTTEEVEVLESKQKPEDMVDVPDVKLGKELGGFDSTLIVTEEPEVVEEFTTEGYQERDDLHHSETVPTDELAADVEVTDVDVSEFAETDSPVDTVTETVAHAAEEETVAHAAEEETVAHAAEEETVTHAAEEETAAQAAEEETVALAAEEEAVTQTVEEETATQAVEEETAAHVAEEETAAQAIEEETVAQTAEEETPGTTEANEEAVVMKEETKLDASEGEPILEEKEVTLSEHTDEVDSSPDEEPRTETAPVLEESDHTVAVEMDEHVVSEVEEMGTPVETVTETVAQTAEEETQDTTEASEQIIMDEETTLVTPETEQVVQEEATLSEHNIALNTIPDEELQVETSVPVTEETDRETAELTEVEGGEVVAEETTETEDAPVTESPTERGEEPSDMEIVTQDPDQQKINIEPIPEHLKAMSLVKDTNEQGKESELIDFHCPWGIPSYSAPEVASDTLNVLTHTSHILGYPESLNLGVFTSFTITKNRFDEIEKSKPPIPDGVYISPEERKGEQPVGCWISDSRLQRSSSDQCSRTFQSDLYKTSNISLRQLYPEEFELPETLNKEGFLLSNLAPLKKGFEEGPRRAILDGIRKWAEKKGPLNVVHGPIFDYNFDGRKDDVTDIRNKIKPLVPSDYFYVVSICNETKSPDDDSDHVTESFHSCPLDNLNVYSFVFPNTVDNDMCFMSDRDYLQYHLASVADIEDLTSLRFFRNLDQRAYVQLRTRQPIRILSLL